MFSSIPFAPKTTQMGKQHICELDLDLIEENCDEIFINPESAFILDVHHFEEPAHVVSDDFKVDDFQNNIQEDFCKKQTFLLQQQQEHQYEMINDFNDLNTIEESLPRIPHNSSNKINEFLLKKINFHDFDFFKESGIEEIFSKKKKNCDDHHAIINDELFNLFTITTIPSIEENAFENSCDAFYEVAKKMEGSKIDFTLNTEFPANLLPREMPKLVFPSCDQRIQPENSSLYIAENDVQSNSSQSSQIKPEIAQISPHNISFKEKCSQSSQTDESKESNSKSRLFPASSKSVTPVKVSTDTRKALIIDERLISLPGFQQAFADYRIIFRTLKSYDMEINERTCIIFRPLLVKDVVHKMAKNYYISYSQLAESLTKFENVLIVISLEDEFKQYNEISDENLKLLSLIYGNQISVKIREFPTNKSAFNFIHSLIDDSLKFLRDCESLHEHLLSLFPTISKSLAQAILRKGNPIIDSSLALDEFPKYNIIPFKQLLDALSDSYKKNKANNQEKTENKSDKIPYSIESDLKPLYTSSNRKINAPFPSTILLANEI